jgi:hypothetical protein
MPADKNRNGAQSRGRETSRRQFLNRFTVLIGGLASVPIFALGSTMSKFASGATAIPLPGEQKIRHVVIFAGTAGAEATDQLKMAGFASTMADSLLTAHAIVSKNTTDVRDGVGVIGIGAGVNTALQFARSNAATKTVIVFGGDHGNALDELAALHTRRSYSVLVLDAPDSAAWRRALSFLGRQMA